MEKEVDNAMLVSPLFDSVFGNEYKLPKNEALDEDNILETVGNMNAEIIDLKRSNEHYRAILLAIIAVVLIKVIFG